MVRTLARTHTHTPFTLVVELVDTSRFNSGWAQDRSMVQVICLP